MSDSELGSITVHRKTGHERFQMNGAELPFDLLGFWQWSASDLVDNVTRGVLAEYIVALDLGIADPGTRVTWDPYDLVTPEGIRVEVKSAAYIQSWEQRRHSAISFGIGRHSAWNARTNTYSEPDRHADVYVFAVLHHRDQTTLDPINLDQWIFYVLPTVVLNEQVPEQSQISLTTLSRLNPFEVRFGEIGNVIREAVRWEQST